VRTRSARRRHASEGDAVLRDRLVASPLHLERSR
jgi:hypothetical protein